MKYWAVVGLLCVSVSQVSAQGHTKEDEAACRPDVFRLCAAEIPNRGRIIVCLERRRAQLSPACHQVFDRNRPTNGGRSATESAQTDGQSRWGR